MAESQTLAVLHRKRDEIERAIANYEKKLDAARHDLLHVNATLRLFEAPENPKESLVYLDTLRLFRHGELASLCKKILVDEGPLDTRELALRVVQVKGFDEHDHVLTVSITYRVVQAMRLQFKEGKIWSPGKRNRRRLWDAKRS